MVKHQSYNLNTIIYSNTLRMFQTNLNDKLGHAHTLTLTITYFRIELAGIPFVFVCVCVCDSQCVSSCAEVTHQCVRVCGLAGDD